MRRAKSYSSPMNSKADLNADLSRREWLLALAAGGLGGRQLAVAAPPSDLNAPREILLFAYELESGLKRGPESAGMAPGAGRRGPRRAPTRRRRPTSCQA